MTVYRELNHQGRRAVYLAHEVTKTVCPPAAARFDARFRGLWSYTRPDGDEGPGRVLDTPPEYAEIPPLPAGRPDGLPAPLIVDALFLELLGLHRPGDPRELSRRLCEKELA
ncbi:MAG: hypothetical protein AB1896_12345, partial [Thermodesulfobacteriota bacterium]